MDGLWKSGASVESFTQSGLTRERILTVNTGATLNPIDASGFAKESPIAPPAGAEAPNMGPHFLLSPETPDGRPTLGFEFALLNVLIPGGQRATAAAGDFTVTVWKLVLNAMITTATRADWVAFTPRTGVQVNQVFRSFDVNACVIRFQVSNIAVDGSIQLMIAEL